jgi:hypothetical protein
MAKVLVITAGHESQITLAIRVDFGRLDLQQQWRTTRRGSEALSGKIRAMVSSSQTIAGPMAFYGGWCRAVRSHAGRADWFRNRDSSRKGQDKSDPAKTAFSIGAGLA